MTGTSYKAVKMNSDVNKTTNDTIKLIKDPKLLSRACLISQCQYRVCAHPYFQTTGGRKFLYMSLLLKYPAGM